MFREGLFGDYGSSTTTTDVVQTTDYEKNDGLMYDSACTYAGEGEGWFHYLNFMFIVMFIIPSLVSARIHSNRNYRY